MKVSASGLTAVIVIFWLTISMPVVMAAEQADGLFWSVSSENGTGYLLGTIHSEEPRVLDYTTEFSETMGGCATFAMELVPNLPTLARLAEYMNYAEGTSLQDTIGEQRFNAVTASLARYGVPPGQIARMKPWAAMMTLSVPPPKTGLFMDFSLSLRAAGSGLKVVGLETLEQQIAFLEDMPLPQQLDLLDQALAEFDNVQQVHDHMVDSYLSGSLKVLMTEAEQQLDVLDPVTRDYFINHGINARNRNMLESLLPYLQQGCVFTAVGALHLPGPEGLLSLLKDNGYSVRPMTSPFVTENP
jgi:uncharacterized protein YbaP (TraB family)